MGSNESPYYHFAIKNKITKHDNLCYYFNIIAHCSIRMSSCHTFYTFTWIVMLKKLFVRKNALNSEVFLWKLFQMKANALFSEPRQPLWICSIHNWMTQKVSNLKLFTFTRHFYPKRLTVHSGYTFCQYVCSLGIEPTTFCIANTMRLPLSHRNTTQFVN